MSPLKQSIARFATLCQWDRIYDKDTYFAEGNANPKPYKWKAKGAEILAKIKHARAALDKAEAA